MAGQRGAVFIHWPASALPGGGEGGMEGARVFLKSWQPVSFAAPWVREARQDSWQAGPAASAFVGARTKSSAEETGSKCEAGREVLAGRQRGALLKDSLLTPVSVPQAHGQERRLPGTEGEPRPLGLVLGSGHARLSVTKPQPEAAPECDRELRGASGLPSVTARQGQSQDGNRTRPALQPQACDSTAGNMTLAGHLWKALEL